MLLSWRALNGKIFKCQSYLKEAHSSCNRVGHLASVPAWKMTRESFMSGTILVWTLNRELFAELSAILTEQTLILCETLPDAEQACDRQEIALVLVAERFGTDDGCAVFRQFQTRHPHVAGLLLTPTEDKVLFRRAMGYGLSGLVALPPEPDTFRCQVA